MVLTIDIMHGPGPCNEMQPQLHCIAEGKAVLADTKAAKVSYALYITNNKEHVPCR